MAKAKPLIEIPLNRHRGIEHYPSYESTWVPNEPFSARLRLRGTIRGRSAAYFVWEDAEDWDREHPMFLAEMTDLVQGAGVEPGGFVSGWWRVCKRGQNYGLKYLGADRPETE